MAVSSALNFNLLRAWALHSVECSHLLGNDGLERLCWKRAFQPWLNGWKLPCIFWLCGGSLCVAYACSAASLCHHSSGQLVAV